MITKLFGMTYYLHPLRTSIPTSGFPRWTSRSISPQNNGSARLCLIISERDTTWSHGATKMFEFGTVGRNLAAVRWLVYKFIYHYLQGFIFLRGKSFGDFQKFLGYDTFPSRKWILRILQDFIPWAPKLWHAWRYGGPPEKKVFCRGPRTSIYRGSIIPPVSCL